MTCKGICDSRYGSRGQYRGGSPGLYAKGYKRCSVCCVSLLWDGLYCPCCGYRLRRFSRARKYRERRVAGRAAA